MANQPATFLINGTDTIGRFKLSRPVASLLLGAVAIMAFGVLAHHALLTPEGFQTRDHVDFYLRVGQYAREVADHHWPQTLPDALRGGGHAFPLYYPPLAPWAALGVHALGLDIIQASHAAALLSVALSGLFEFLLLRQLTGSIGAALLGAACYIVFPYRYQLLQGRGSFAEGWLLAWLPAVVLATTLRGRARTLWLPVSISLLVLSHTALAGWVLPLVTLLLWRAEVTSRLGLASARTFVGGTLVAVGIAMFYLLPVRLGLAGINASDAVLMWTTPGSVAAGEQLFSGSAHPALLASLASLASLAIAASLLRHARPEVAARRWAAAALISLLVCTAVLAAPVPPWRLAPALLRYIQSPIRLLGPMAFLIATITGLWASVALAGRPGRVAVLVLVLLGAGWAWGGGSRKEGVPLAELARLPHTTYSDLGFTLVGEYLPRGADPARLAARIEATRRQAGRPPLTAWRSVPSGFEARVDAPRGTPVPLPLVAYDFHEVRRVDGRSIDVTLAEGQLVVIAPGGPVDLIVRRRLSPGMLPGLAISLGTLCLLLWSVRARGSRGTRGVGRTPRPPLKNAVASSPSDHGSA